MREMLKEVIQHQAFWGNVEQADLAAATARHNALLLLPALGGVEAGGGHTVRQQLIDLIFHQRYQRRYHHRQTALYQRRNLIAEGFPAAGRHDHQTVAPSEHGLNDGLLARTELLVAEGVPQNLPCPRLQIQYFRLRHVNPICLQKMTLP